MSDSRDAYWRYVAEDDEDRSNIHALRWDVYTKAKEKLINREFSVAIPHLKGGEIVWTCVKDNAIEEKEDYKAI